jgi:hypothetical protein
MPSDKITHRIADDQFDTLINGLSMLIAELRLTSHSNTTPATPEQPEAPVGEPWTFYDPHLKREVGTWVDGRNQVRHAPLNRADEVPSTWRRILLAPPRVPPLNPPRKDVPMSDSKNREYPASADHAPGEPSEVAKTLHGDLARDEVIDQPEAVTLPADTRIATPGRDSDADN